MPRLLKLCLPLALAALACNLPFGGPTPTVEPTLPPATTAAPTATATIEAATATLEPTAEVTVEAPTVTVEATTPAPAEVNLLAYVAGGHLLVTNVAGGVAGGTTQYTVAGLDDQVQGPVWSPSGEFIAYTSQATTEPHIFYVFAAGAGTPIDLGPGSTPRWSPDSTRLVYQREGNIWLTTIDNPAPVPLTFQNNWAWGAPVFMPDGSAVVVAGNSFDQLGASGNTTFGLSAVPLDGTGALTPLPGMTQTVDGRFPYDLTFSPNGQLLAFSTTFHLSACSGVGTYYVASADGSNLRTVEIPSLASFFDPTKDITLRGVSFDWLPGSEGLALTGGVWDCEPILSGGEPSFLAGPQLSVVGLDGSEPLIIPAFLYQPSYDRTGTMLAAILSSDTATARVQVFASGSGAFLLDLGEGTQPTFQP